MLRSDTRVHDYRDVNERHPEHIAAINGDKMFLCWLLKNHWIYCRTKEQLKSRKTIAASDEPKNTHLWSLPRDSMERTPLHYAAMNEKSFYRIVKMYERGADQNLFSHVEDLDAVDVEGKTALEYATGPSSSMEASLEALRQKTFGGTLKQLVGEGSFMSGHCDRTDYAAMWKFAHDHGLDLRDLLAESVRHCRGYADETNAAVFMSVEYSNLPRLQFALKAQGLSVASVRTNEGLDLMHVTAGRTAEKKQDMKHFEGLLKRDDGDLMKQMLKSEASCLSSFLQCWDGESDLLAAMEKDAKNWDDGHGSFYRLRRSEPEECCTGGHKRHTNDEPNFPTVAHRLSVVRWLISTGRLPLPECEFIVRECDLPAQKLLFEYRYSIKQILALP